jgi:hypothetical protein
LENTSVSKLDRREELAEQLDILDKQIMAAAKAGASKPSKPPTPPDGKPDKALARQEAMTILESHPDKSPAIRARFKQIYGEDL